MCLKLNICPLNVSPPSFFLISINSNNTQPIILPFLPSPYLSINSNVCMVLWRRKWQPTPVFLPGESQGWGSLVGCRLWVPQSQTRLKQLGSSSSSNPNYLAKAPSSSTTTLGVRSSTYEFWGDTFSP